VPDSALHAPTVATEVQRLRMPWVHAVTCVARNAFISSRWKVPLGGDLTDMYRQVGVYTGWILKGEKPADLPVQQSTKVELQNRQALSLTVPLPLIGRADEGREPRRRKCGVALP
jgi:hypothetical protein